MTDEQYTEDTHTEPAGIIEAAPVEVVIDTVDEAQVEPIVEVEVVPEPIVVVEPTPEPVKPAKVVRGHSVSGKGTDDVFLKNCVYMNKAARKSLTVHHLQRRLNELGYAEAYSDKDGWYGDLTKVAVEKYQKDNKLAVTGLVDEKTFTSIFAGDSLVTPII